MKRTTILLDDALLLDAQHLARQRGTTFTALIDEAIRAYLQAHRAPRRLTCIGVGRGENLSRSLRDGGDEADLRAGIDRVGGWSPRRRVSATHMDASVTPASMERRALPTEPGREG